MVLADWQGTVCVMNTCHAMGFSDLGLRIFDICAVMHIHESGSTEEEKVGPVVSTVELSGA